MFNKTVYGFTAVAAVAISVAVSGIGLALANDSPASSTAAPASAQSVHVPATYEAMDTSHAGMVTEKEAMAAMPNLNFKAADENGDGQLDRVEFLDLQQKVADGTWTNAIPKKEVVKDIKGYDENPVDVVTKAPKGSLKNPYDPANITVAAEGHQQFLNHGCNACHGGNGGGGMCPPLNNGVWIYGPSDDTLFRLVSLGSKKLQEAGYSRVNQETPALMPQQGGTTVTKAGELWKIITWIKSMNMKNQTSMVGAPLSLQTSGANGGAWFAEQHAVTKVCGTSTSAPWDASSAR
ncbi:MAG: c-type cytochrome [Rhodanobacter sp.]